MSEFDLNAELEELESCLWENCRIETLSGKTYLCAYDEFFFMPCEILEKELAKMGDL